MPDAGLDPEGARALLDSASVLADLPEAARQTGATDAADAFRATIVWTAGDELLPGRSYELRRGTESATATVAPLRYRLDLATGEHVAATVLRAGEIGVCDLELEVRIAPPDPAGSDRATDFSLNNRASGGVVGVGRLQFALRRSDNVRRQAMAVDKAARAALLEQRPAVVWLTGLPGAGKSTIANLVASELHRRGRHAYVLDGDNVRHGLNSDLGFTPADRVENIRRIGEVAALMVDAGLIVLVSFISPYRAERSMARSLVADDEFIEVHVDVPLEVAEQRDPKGLYRKARAGQLVNLTGIDSPYEPPEAPDVQLRTNRITPEDAAARVIAALEAAGRLSPTANR